MVPCIHLSQIEQLIPTHIIILLLRAIGSSYLDESGDGIEDEQAYWSYEDANKGSGTTEETPPLKHTPVSIRLTIHPMDHGEGFPAWPAHGLAS